MDGAPFDVRLVNAILAKQKREHQQARLARGNVQAPQVGASSTKRVAEDMEEPEQGPATKKLKPLPDTVNDFIDSQASWMAGRHDAHHWPTDPATGQLVPEEDMDFDTPHQKC